MIAKLERLKREHSSECLDTHGAKFFCTCGADVHNALLNEIIKDVKELIAS